MKNMIEIKNVTKFFKNEKIFENLNLVLEENKIYGFVGRNGSGKSVLFKLICGYCLPDKGEILISGKKIGKEIDFPENLGALIENPGFMKYETGFKNLYYLAKIRNEITNMDIRETMRMVGLDPYLKKHVGKYSLGMRQRLGIAQAIMEKPRILILDEPMNGLDENGVMLIRKIILQYKKDNRVILLASHNKEDINILCDEVFELNDGKLVQTINRGVYE